MKQKVCITGMHRSGTSLIASWMERLGLPVHDGSFHGPAAGNSKGHFEDKEFVDIHINALMSQYPNSKGWQVFSENALVFSFEQKQRIKELVQKREEKFQMWGWKDPRSLFFLEDWKKTYPDLKVLLLWRPCSEVVKSLVVRSAKASNNVFFVSNNQALDMWMIYNSRLLNYKRNHPTDSILFNVHDILLNTDKSFAKINDFLNEKLSHFDIMKIFDTTLFNNQSIDENDSVDHIVAVKSIHHKLMSLSEKFN